MGNTIQDTPGIHTKEAYVKAHAAATTTENNPIFVAPFACTIIGVTIIPQDDVTGADTDSTNLNIFKQATTPVEIGNYDLEEGNDLEAMTPYDFDVTETALNEDGVLYLQHEKVGDGLLVPELKAQVHFKAR